MICQTALKFADMSILNYLNFLLTILLKVVVFGIQIKALKS